MTLGDLARIRGELQQIDEHLNIGVRVEGIYNSQHNKVSLRIGCPPSGVRQPDVRPAVQLAPIPGAVRGWRRGNGFAGNLQSPSELLRTMPATRKYKVPCNWG